MGVRHVAESGPVGLTRLRRALHNAAMRCVAIAALLAAAGIAPACDVTGWPSTAQHPHPARAVAPAELWVSWRMERVPDAGARMTLQDGIRTSAGVAATVLTGSGPDNIKVTLPSSTTEWTAVDRVIRHHAPAATCLGATVRILTERMESAAELERALRGIPGLGLAGITMDGKRITLAFPPDVPYPSPSVWRARRYLAAAPRG